MLGNNDILISCKHMLNTEFKHNQIFKRVFLKTKFSYFPT